MRSDTPGAPAQDPQSTRTSVGQVKRQAKSYRSALAMADHRRQVDVYAGQHEPPPLRRGYSASRRPLLSLLAGMLDDRVRAWEHQARVASPKCTRYGGSPPAPRTSTISPIRSDWPTMLPRTCNRSPTAACVRPPPHPRSHAARATEDRLTVCALSRQVSISMPIARPGGVWHRPSTAEAVDGGSRIAAISDLANSATSNTPAAWPVTRRRALDGHHRREDTRHAAVRGPDEDLTGTKGPPVAPGARLGQPPEPYPSRPRTTRNATTTVPADQTSSRRYALRAFLSRPWALSRSSHAPRQRLKIQPNTPPTMKMKTANPCMLPVSRLAGDPGKVNHHTRFSGDRSGPVPPSR